MLLDNKDSFTFNIVELLRNEGLEVDVIDNEADLEHIDSGGYDALVISPGPGNPMNQRDRGIGLELLKKGFPATLGICFGNQLIGYHLGCEIYRTDSIMHGEIDTMENLGTGLLSGIPGRFSAVRYHSLAIKPNRNIIVDAVSATDGTAMAFHSEDGRNFGLQFHPESYYSQYGREILRNFIGVASEHR